MKPWEEVEMAVLVDTSVWIDLFRGRESEATMRLRKMLAEDVELVIGDLILAELLQGVRHESELRRVEAAFRAYRVEPLVGETLARRSASNYRLLRTQGITVRKTIDRFHHYADFYLEPDEVQSELAKLESGLESPEVAELLSRFVRGEYR